MTELKGKNILVMGGSGVLGGLIATELASHGATVMATSSTLESAEKVPHAGNPLSPAPEKSSCEKKKDKACEHLLSHDYAVLMDTILLFFGSRQLVAAQLL